MAEVRVRFAPSPTGPLHIGGARSALFNYLFAQKLGGKLILRIEDTDRERSRRESEINIYESLRWLGINWDEGPDVGGDYGPYRQMERLSLYQEYTQRLLAEGKAYYCYCTEEELAAARQEARTGGGNPKYSGKCRALTAAEKRAYEAAGRKPVVRFRVPAEQKIVIQDLVRGEVVFQSEDVGDFVLVKSDGVPTYNYAVVIDDALMKISHVLRAEEHLSNTPRQLLLYEALGFPLPEFAHISLILGKDRSKMSKRHGATSVVQYKEEGYLPEAVVNFLALLGWAPVGEEEIFSMAALIQEFSLERVAKNPAVFDLEKLQWLNSLYIRECDPAVLQELALPYFQNAGFIAANPSAAEKEWVRLILTAYQDRLLCLQDVAQQAAIFRGEEVRFTGQAADVLQQETFPLVLRTFYEHLAALDVVNMATVKMLFKNLLRELKLKGQFVYMPIRVALTGQEHGPELPLVLEILGKDLALRRVARLLAGN